MGDRLPPGFVGHVWFAVLLVIAGTLIAVGLVKWLLP